MKVEVGDWVKCQECTNLGRYPGAGFTPGKVYKVLDVLKMDPDPLFGLYFRVRDDKGSVELCCTGTDVYVGGKNWIVCSFEENLKKVLEGE